MSDTAKGFYVFILFLVLFAVCGRLNYLDDQAKNKAYCDNVGKGVWPDYQHKFQKVCIDAKK